MKMINGNTIIGKVASPDALTYVWAVSGQDSIIAPAINGSFSVKVKPGRWKLLLHTISPYKDQVIENVLVTEGRPTNLGEIKLLQ
jgi:hypothetical protein